MQKFKIKYILTSILCLFLYSSALSDNKNKINSILFGLDLDGTVIGFNIENQISVYNFINDKLY